MNTSNLIVLTLIYTALLLMVQRTERKRRLIVALAIPVIGYMTYQWALLKDQRDVLLWSAGIALGLNVVFWLVWGRTHPAGTSDSIKVIGMEE